MGIISLMLLLPACTSKNLDLFAQCVSKSGMVLYGTYWCPHCANVKKAFGSSLKYINYVECDDKGPNGQHAKCQMDGVDAYPAFIFGDGQIVKGELPLEVVAEKTGCELPK